MKLFSDFRAGSFSHYTWLCDPTLADWLVRLLQPYGSSLLDVGCGNGYMLPFYAKNFKKVSAIDPSESLAPYVRQQLPAQVDFRVAPAEDIPFGNQTFDIAIAKSCLHHFTDERKGLDEMGRVSRSLVAVVEVVAPSDDCLPFLRNLLVRKEETRTPNTVYTIESIRKLLIETEGVQQVHQLLYDQYIDINTWLYYSDLSEQRQQELLEYILSMDPATARHMQLHQRDGRDVMLRRMCLSLGLKKCG